MGSLHWILPQAAKDKIALQRRELEEHQHELDTLQAKIVSASNGTANTSFQEDSTGMTPPIRNMLRNFLAALTSAVPMESTEVIAAFESILLQETHDNMDSANQEDEETPMATWTTVVNRRLNGKTHVETPRLKLQLQVQG